MKTLTKYILGASLFTAVAGGGTALYLSYGNDVEPENKADKKEISVESLGYGDLPPPAVLTDKDKLNSYACFAAEDIVDVHIAIKRMNNDYLFNAGYIKEKKIVHDKEHYVDNIKGFVKKNPKASGSEVVAATKLEDIRNPYSIADSIGIEIAESNYLDSKKTAVVDITKTSYPVYRIMNSLESLHSLVNKAKYPIDLDVVHHEDKESYGFSTEIDKGDDRFNVGEGLTICVSERLAGAVIKELSEYSEKRNLMDNDVFSHNKDAPAGKEVTVSFDADVPNTTILGRLFHRAQAEYMQVHIDSFAYNTTIIKATLTPKNTFSVFRERNYSKR